MFNYRKFADKAQPAITNVGTAITFALFPWSTVYTWMVALTSAILVAAIGSITVWAIPMLVLIITFAITGSMLLLVRKKVVYVASQYKQLEHDNQHLHQALKNATGEVNAANKDRDAALEALKVWLKRFAYSKLSRIAQILNRDTDGVINVDVRFATPDDRLLAEKIQDIIKLRMGWPVTLNGDLTIKPNNEFKVSFVSDLAATFHEIAEAFKLGSLLDDISVGVRELGVLEDKRRLVVEVSPTVLGVKETISQT